MATRKHTGTTTNDWLLRITVPIGYIIGVGGPALVIVLGIMGKLPS